MTPQPKDEAGSTIVADILVIGGGLGGAMAALQAAQGGAKVVWARAAPGRILRASGGLGLGLQDGRWPKLQGGFEAMQHPYARMGQAQVLQIWKDIQKTLQGSGLMAGAKNRAGEQLPVWSSCAFENRIAWPSTLGRWVPLAGAPQPSGIQDEVWDGAAFWHKGHRVGLATMDGCLGHGHGQMWASYLAQGSDALENSIDVTWHPMDMDLGAACDASQCDGDGMLMAAAAMDREDVWRPWVDKLVTHSQAAEQAGKPLAGWLVPPVLGVASHGAIIAALEQRLDIPVMEALAAGKSGVGLRLYARFAEACAQAGVIETGKVFSVCEISKSDKVLSAETHQAASQTATTASKAHLGYRATLARSEMVQAQSLVLATGRFEAGGLQWPAGQACYETLLGCEVFGDQGRLKAGYPMGSIHLNQQNFWSEAGVWVDAKMRVHRMGGGDMHPMGPGIFAAGSLVGGWASHRIDTAEGPALVTGAMAAQSALAWCLSHKAGGGA